MRAAILSALMSAQGGADVILAWGQSNMFGRGTPVDTAGLDAPDSMISQYCMYAEAGKAYGAIIPAAEPMQYPSEQGGSRPSGIGPALSFAKAHLAATNRKRPIIIIPSAVGGTKLVTSGAYGWSTNYSSNLRTQAISAANAAVLAGGVGSRVVAIIGIQGEADAISSVSGATYQAELQALAANFRAFVSTASSAPFVLCGMVPEFVSGTAADIRAVHANIATYVTRSAYVAGPSSSSIGDNLHYNAVAQRSNGAAMYAAMQAAA